MPEKHPARPAATGDSAETFADRVRRAIAGAAELRVVTSIGGVIRDASGDPALLLGDDARIMLTRFNLLDGDITTVMDPAFVDGPYDRLREFHQAQVDTGLARVRDNIEALKQLYELARSMF